MNELNVRVEEILQEAGLLDEVHKQRELLSGILRVVRSQANMDRDTIVYRLGMMIYHSKAATGNPLIPAIEDPAALYLRTLKNPRLQAILEETRQKYGVLHPPDLVKTLMCFLLAAYIDATTT